MKKTLLSLAIATSLLSTTAFATEIQLETVNQKASYTLGVDLAKNFLAQGIEIDTKALYAGMNDSLNNQPLQLTAEEMQKSIIELQDEMVKKQAQKRAELADKNTKIGAEFMAKNKLKEGVTTLPSGLQYRIITAGKGDHPTADDYITAHYKGTLIDGTEFDSSFARGEPIEFKMDNVIKGWGEALKKMRPGSKWTIYVPPALAYGEQGAGATIGPNETLIFTIELIKVGKE